MVKIRNLILRLAFVALLAGPVSVGQAAGKTAGGKITIVGFGDSITEAATQMPDEYKRWLKILDQRLTEALPACRFSVINSGRGGNSAKEAMGRLDRDVLAHNPDYVILEFGGNNNDPNHPARRVPPAEFKEVLERFKTAVAPKAKIIVVTFPPVIREWHAYWNNPKSREYLEKSDAEMGLEKYVALTRAFATENKYPVFDLHQVLADLGKANGRETYTLPDGVHLTEAGNKVLAEGVFDILKTLIEEK
jgi:lysophospholipase L1-like esterase